MPIPIPVRVQVRSASNTIRRMLMAMARAVRWRARINLRAMAQDPRKAQALREDLAIQIVSIEAGKGTAAVRTDYYWAVYYHDGRGPVRARPGKFLVYYVPEARDLDPRTGGASFRYPRRSADIRKLNLSKDEFFSLLHAGLIVMTKRVGPAEAHPFFKVGMQALNRRYGQQVSRLMGEYVLGSLLAEDLYNAEERADLSI